MNRTLFEIRHMIAAPVTLFLLAWFALYAALNTFLPRKLVVVLAFLTGFVLADVLYNLTVGSFLFWERPKEWLFTDRLKRLHDADVHAVDRFVVVLNSLDEGHV